MTNSFTSNFFNFASPEEILLTYDEDIQNKVITLHDWQINFLRAFADPANHEDPNKLMLIANNSAGKSQIILAPCIVWLAVSFDDSLGYVTSSSAHQLDTQTERAIDRICDRMDIVHRKSFGGNVWDNIKRKKVFKPTKSFIDLIATDEPKRAEGKHPLAPYKEFGLFVDEGKSIEEDIYDALSRCHGFTRRLDVSSPGGCIGHFYKTATADETVYDLSKHNVQGWRCLRVTSFDCPHISQKEIKTLILAKGLHDPLVRSTHFAEFTSVDSKVVIPRHIYEECIKYAYKNTFKHIKWEGGFRAGLDLAGGGDEVVLSVWDGNLQVGQEVMRGTANPDTIPIVNEIISWFVKWGFKGGTELEPLDVNVIADDGGIGRGIIGHLKSKGYTVKRWLNGWRALDNTHYANRGTENWFTFKRFVEEYQCKLLEDKVLKEQFTNRHYGINGSKLLIQLESKEKAKSNGHPSPDRADASVLAWAELAYPCKYITGETEQESNTDENKIANTKRMSVEELLRWHRETLFSGERNRHLSIGENKSKQAEPILQRDILERANSYKELENFNLN